MTGLILLIVLVLLLLLVQWLARRPHIITNWVARRMMRNMQREAQRRQREYYNNARRNNPYGNNGYHGNGASYGTGGANYGTGYSSRSTDSGGGSSYGGSRREPLIPKEYAVDVEFVETKEYSSTREIASDGGDSAAEDRRRGPRRRVKVETQVSDVEYVEFKDKTERNGR